MIPIISRPTRVKKKTATAIDNILSNFLVDKNFISCIFKSDVSDHFPVNILVPSVK